MLFDGILMELLPLLAFTVVSLVWGLKPGIYVMVLGTALRCLYLGMSESEIPIYLIALDGFVIFMGVLSLLLDRSLVFKLQPTITHAVAG